ncbi:glyoxalase superfamily protein [Pseudosulfitobacter pseudonitzschiae]|uniref:glyoxalase superfamily protein n=1 Tax=Pseudosulfitobacter pseudonitzschiae TaxID=1402135 RepID=UPI001AF72E15|nr:glyoxalase superfamily protein [Pseudosulfitobacter pseudonitzschiae]MBM1813752.1 VOC family protein [Pseudosulfitobacter pseudonitzschiae]MBM1830745.1 VOC family protein [Pseudosulfitobacter pseudonitzschiae]MBM1835612.1 VOC family protein [Pseudosulfitobacter pseudonitzschiae]MBM1840458.1 VOC family protein [Pseudosulfitobacter pseudonitzschiae]MBM1845554.1 VOC family protein [Pseudosulfitobacter pseudonitzschiae]
MQAAAPIPILRSFDEAKAREFYVDFLGFEVVFEHRFAPDLPLYMSLRMGDCEVHLSEHHGDAAPGAALRIGVPDVAAYAAALCAKNYGFARPGVQRQPYGMDDMSVADPFGNRLIFCTPVPDS